MAKTAVAVRAVAVAICLLWAVTKLHAGEMDILLRKLVEKGILTEGEAVQVLAETQTEMKKEVAKGLAEGLPKFIQETKFSGDLRLRYQWEEASNATKEDRQRGRFRLRFGFDTTVNDKTKAGIRLATGAKEPTSTNQTFDDDFVGKPIAVDRAYINYQPTSSLSLAGGKLSNPYFTTDLLWDSDVNPEGAYLSYAPAFTAVSPFVTIGFFSLDESRVWSADPCLISTQIGMKTKIAGHPLQLAFGYNNFMGLKGKKVTDVSPNYNKKGNSLSADDRWIYDYRVLAADMEYSPFQWQIGNQSLPLKLYGQYLRNVYPGVPADQKSGWLAGFSLGKTKSRGDWEFGYNYRRLGADATLDILTDSDFHGGGTNGRGHKFTVSYAAAKNTVFGLTYFDTGSLTGTRKDVKMLQVDCVVKW